MSLAGAEEGAAGVIALLVAIFVSFFPETLVGAVAMRSGRSSRRFVGGIWTVAAVLLSVAVVVGRVVADALSPGTLAFALSFAGGAVLASLADTLTPEAFERGRPLTPWPPRSTFSWRSSCRTCDRHTVRPALKEGLTG